MIDRDAVGSERGRGRGYLELAAVHELFYISKGLDITRVAHDVPDARIVQYGMGVLCVCIR